MKPCLREDVVNCPYRSLYEVPAAPMEMMVEIGDVQFKHEVSCNSIPCMFQQELYLRELVAFIRCQ